MFHGQCHCGAIQYEMPENILYHTLCHCTDCRRHSGAPLVGWAAVHTDELRVSGTAKIYKSSQNGRRHFCSECGTGLFYTNEEILPGITDVASGTLDDPDRLPPQAHIQAAERLAWMRDISALPEFARYPD